MHNVKGFALIQALFFMMFIMAVISITMLMSRQREISAEGERMATDVYPAVNAFVEYAQSQLTAMTPSVFAPEYFNNFPLSNHYITNTLLPDGFSDPTQCYDPTEKKTIACQFDATGKLVAGQVSNLQITLL